MARDPNETIRDEVRELVQDIDDVEMRELCIKALRSWRARFPGQDDFAAHGDLGRALIPLLAKRADVDIAVGRQSMEDAVHRLLSPFIDHPHEPWLGGFVEFLHWFTRAGFAFPLGPGAHYQYPVRFRLTRSGSRFLDSPDEDHPLLPQFVERVKTRCPGMPTEVMSLLVDARACLDQMLLRPAIVVMGVAYEVTIEAVAEALITKGTLPAAVRDQNAAKRITTIKTTVIDQLPKSTGTEIERRSSLTTAYIFADDLRRRRNDASHTRPRYGFEDREEVEEILVSAGRQLPVVWSLA